jgi:hypothetical protein
MHKVFTAAASNLRWNGLGLGNLIPSEIAASFSRRTRNDEGKERITLPDNTSVVQSTFGIRFAQYDNKEKNWIPVHLLSKTE